MKKKRYELWWSDSEGSYTFFADDNNATRAILPGDAVIDWHTEASSWAEAQTKMHEHLGWEAYKPMNDK